MATWCRLTLATACLIAAANAVALPSAAVDASAAPAEGRGLQHSRNSIQGGDDLMSTIYNDCLRKNSVSCVKYKLFSFVDKVLSSKDSFSITEGVTVVKTPGAAADAKVGQGTPRALGENDDLESLLVGRVEQFLETHTLKIDVSGKELVNSVTAAGRALGDVADGLGLTEEETEETDGATEEGRGKKKKAQKILMPLLMALKLKAAALIPLALGAIALIAGKALLIGKIALLLAAIIGLKKLLSQQKTVTYEIVAHPHHSSSHGGGHDAYSAVGGGAGGGGGFGGGDASGGYGSSGSGGHGGGWGRSLDAQQMAYRGYVQAQAQQ